jgi:hypothetical protein
LFDKYLQKALDEWDFPDGIDPQKSREKFSKIASYLQLAINNAAGPIPNTLGRMSFVMVQLNDINKAKHFSNLAIQQEQHNIFGRLTKFFLAIIDLQGYNPWYATGNYSSGYDAMFSMIGLGAALISKSSKVRNVKSAARDLGWAFMETVRLESEDNVEGWITFGEMLLDLSDGLKQDKMTEPYLYKAVASANWNKVTSTEYREKVADLRARAQALYNLAGGI